MSSRTSIHENYDPQRPEDICAECGRPNAKPWFAPSDVWNRVMRKEGQPEPIICPVCFIQRAEEAGIECTGWEVRPENYVPKEAANKSPAPPPSAYENTQRGKA